jgi:hypothetical protein
MSRLLRRSLADRLPGLRAPGGVESKVHNRTTPEHARRALADAVDANARRLAAHAEGSLDVQLLAQLSPAADYPRVLAHWEQRTSGRGTRAWPKRLAPDTFALHLWPIPAGRVGLAAGLGAAPDKRHPKRLVATPAFGVIDPARNADPHTGLAVLLATWLDGVAATERPSGVRLAPPVLESWSAGGRLRDRAVMTFDLGWQLPVADGVG